jgi:hypothetical protein
MKVNQGINRHISEHSREDKERNTLKKINRNEQSKSMYTLHSDSSLHSKAISTEESSS